MTAPTAPMAVQRRLAACDEITVRAAVAAIKAEAPQLRGRDLLEAASALRRSVAGVGGLEPLLRDPAVTDICINGPGPVWVDRGDGLRRSAVSIELDADLRALAVRLVSAAGQRLDDAVPYADARLSDGTRVHAVLPPITPGGVHLSLRIPARRGFDLDELVRCGSVPADGGDLLRQLVRSGIGFIVTGGTGTGKTTVLGCLLGHVPPEQRIVIVEDCAELSPRHPHVVKLEVRRPNAEGRGGVAMDELVRQALRMRPDRLVVGEARGPEIGDLLMALNTGHAGGCGTVHVDRPQQLPARIEALASLRGWSREAAQSQLTAAIDAVVHLRRGADGRRVVAGIAILQLREGAVVAEPAWRFGEGSVTAEAGASAYAERVARR